jgi:hypothetical protein
MFLDKLSCLLFFLVIKLDESDCVAFIGYCQLLIESCIRLFPKHCQIIFPVYTNTRTKCWNQFKICCFDIFRCCKFNSYIIFLKL